MRSSGGRTLARVILAILPIFGSIHSVQGANDIFDRYN